MSRFIASEGPDDWRFGSLNWLPSYPFKDADASGASNTLPFVPSSIDIDDEEEWIKSSLTESSRSSDSLPTAPSVNGSVRTPPPLPPAIMYMNKDFSEQFNPTNTWIPNDEEAPDVVTAYQNCVDASQLTHPDGEIMALLASENDAAIHMGCSMLNDYSQVHHDSRCQGIPEVSAGHLSIGPRNTNDTPDEVPSSTTRRRFRCWVASCPHSNEGFVSIKERKAHYELTHPELILKCRKSGCKFQSFIREKDRAKHEAKLHSGEEFRGILEVIRATEADVNTSEMKQDTSSIDEASGNVSTSKRLIASEEDASTHRCSIGPDSQRSCSTYSDGTVGFDTDSTWSEAESEWEEDDIDPRELLAQTIEDSETSVRPLLSPMKRKLVEGITREFWVIFNQEWSANIRECSQGSPKSTSSSFSQRDSSSGEPSNSRLHKRAREGGEDEEPKDDNGRNPKRPKVDSSSLESTPNRVKFACPYRKHDPRTYCHQTRRWRSCALTPLDTIARVKGHLYRYHRIFQCPRCKALFGSADDLERHPLEVKACELNQEQPADGITGSIEKKLRSRKKAHRGQSESERWQEMYKILFPEEGVPSPYFEAIQDDTVRSPDSEELTSYEEYSRRELPRFFQSALEAAIADEAQPIEERLRSQLVGMIKDCQDRVFSTYKAKRGIDTPAPAVADDAADSGDAKRRREDQPGIIETLYARAPPPTELPSHPETAVPEIASKPLTANISFDSGYGSEPPISNSESSSSKDIVGSETATASSSQEQGLPETPQELQKTKGMDPPFTMPESSMQEMYGYDAQGMSSSQSAMDKPFSWDEGLEGFNMEKWMSLNSAQTEGEDIWREWDSFR